MDVPRAPPNQNPALPIVQSRPDPNRLAPVRDSLRNVILLLRVSYLEEIYFFEVFCVMRSHFVEISPPNVIFQVTSTTSQ